MVTVWMFRMNALLASGEVPGLYEGKELTALMAGCREAAQRDGVLVDSEEELFRRFTTKVLGAMRRGIIGRDLREFHSSNVSMLVSPILFASVWHVPCSSFRR